jgi:hypothetical protein
LHTLGQTYKKLLKCDNKLWLIYLSDHLLFKNCLVGGLTDLWKYDIRGRYKENFVSLEREGGIGFKNISPIYETKNKVKTVFVSKLRCICWH